jgi:phosphonate transport system substrate-binding protein
MIHIKKIFIPVCLSLLIIMGCSESKTEPEPKVPDQETKLLIGLIPARNIFKQLERYEPVANYLSKKTVTNIELKVLTRYGNIIDNFVSAGLDAAFFGSFTYTLAHAKLGVEVVARPESAAGLSSYYGLIFVRKDSGIKNANDMRGKIFAFVDKATTAGHLFPLAYFGKNGISDPNTFFKESYFTGTHEDAIYDVLNKKADVGAAKNTVFFPIADTNVRIADELDILERSLNVPENGLAVRKDLDDSIKNKLKQALLSMHNDPEGAEILKNFGASKFIETTRDDYKNVYDLVEQVGLDLATYDYINE